MTGNLQAMEKLKTALDKKGEAADYYRSRVSALRDTAPKILLDNYKEDPAGLCMRKKERGIWRGYTWAQVYEKVKYMALGLRAHGIQKGEKVVIIGDNDPEWYWAELAILCMGSVVVGLYIDAMASDVEYIVSNSDSVFAFAKDQEHVDKFLEIKDKIPAVRGVAYWDDKGMVKYKDNPWLTELDELIEKGKVFEKEVPHLFEKNIEEGNENDLAVLCYTSGTTSLPKGAMINHRYLIIGTLKLASILLPGKDDDYLSFIPPAWISEQLMIVYWLMAKIKANFPEKPETVMQNIREIGPKTLTLGPMQWQSMISMVQMNIFETGLLRRIIYDLSMNIGYRIADYQLQHRKKPPFYLKVLHGIANIFCLSHIRDQLGLARTRNGLTGGAALGADAFRWYLAMGVKLREGYGMTEVNPVTLHDDLIKPGTSGPVIPGVKIRQNEEGEIFIYSDALFDGYYKNPEETRSTLVDGWIKTGDCGTFDEDQHLVIYDRMKDMLPLKGGGRYSPTYIQNRLKFSPYIKDAMIIGGEEREFLFGIITIDFDNVGRWAEKNRLSYTTFVDLSQKDDVYSLIEKEVVRVNSTLPPEAKVVRYTLLHKEFDADEGELTKTRKLRRGFLEERYGELIRAAFKGRDKMSVEAEVKYRDGRKGKVETDLKISSVE